MRGGRGSFGALKDEYGNPLPPSNAFGPAPPMGVRRDRSEPPMRRKYSDDDMNYFGGRGGRGRGGYPGRGYGRGRPSGAAPMRGGFARGQMGPPPQRGPPPPNYGNEYPVYDRPGQYENPSAAGYARSPSAPGYGRRNYSPAPPGNTAGYGRRSPGPPSAPGRYDHGPPHRGPPSDPGGYGRAPSRGAPSDPGGYGRVPSRGAPSDSGAYTSDRNRDRQQFYEPPQQPYREPSPPEVSPAPRQPEDYGTIGQAVEMDARHGSPSANAPPLNDSGSTVRGLVNLQQQQQQQAHRESPMSVTSVYSGNEYVTLNPKL